MQTFIMLHSTVFPPQFYDGLITNGIHYIQCITQRVHSAYIEVEHVSEQQTIWDCLLKLNIDNGAHCYRSFENYCHIFIHFKNIDIGIRSQIRYSIIVIKTQHLISYLITLVHFTFFDPALINTVTKMYTTITALFFVSTNHAV